MKKQSIFLLLICVAVFTLSIRPVFSQCSPLGNAAYYIKSSCGKYLTLQNLDTKAGTPVVLSDFNGSLAQQWKFIPRSPVPGEGYFYIQSNKVDRVLDVARGKDEDGTRVNLWNLVGGLAQEWESVQMDINLSFTQSRHKIRSRIGLKHLDKGGGPCSNNTPLMIWSQNNTPAQIWYYEAVVPTPPAAPKSPSRAQMLKTKLVRQ
jgi:hypothetical protein